MFTRLCKSFVCRFPRLMAGVFLLASMAVTASAEDSTAKFMGVGKCKNCHRSKTKGDQFGKWEQSKHAKAFENLASEECKKVGKEKGVDDPQTSEKCVKCHVTAFGVDAKQLDKKFDPKLGVQCESCHGPGEVHVKARMAAAADVAEGEEPPAPAPEVLAKEIKRDKEVCIKCHNQDSPSYKEFKFEERWKEIDHSNPTKKK